MINFNNLTQYKENNRLEAKRASGGLPQSLWETYCAFANTNGGVILLGVEEKADNTLSAKGVDNPEKMVTDFWNTINNPQKVSINLLSDKRVEIIVVDGMQIISIDVPRAERTDKPIYVGENPFTGTFRRNGEGDYRCDKEEVKAMLRDQSARTQDMLVLEKMDFSVLSYETIRSYRNVMKLTRPEHIWINLEDDEFLYRIGAVAYGEDKRLHPTAAGLLMFGYEYEILKEYPHYFLDYQEQFDASERWDDRFVSSSGEWSGNVYDFYRKAYNKISQHIKVPFKIVDGLRVEDTPVHKAVREALANCLINADYYGRRGLVIKYKPGEITMANPGRFRIDIALAVEGTTTDPRNALLMKFFNLIDVGERSGRGIYEIYRVWESMSWETPTLTEALDFDRTVLTLPLKKTTVGNNDKKIVTQTDNKSINDLLSESERIIMMPILVYLEKNDSIDNSTAKELTGKSTATVKRYLSKLCDLGILQLTGTARSSVYIKTAQQ